MGAGVTGFPHAAFAARYAPVHEVRVLSLSGNRLRGVAVPDGGPWPSAVILGAGKRVLGVAIATSFSEEAKASGMRYGWCGFELSGLQHALAFGPRGEIRCAITNRLLITLDDEAIAGAASSLSTDITVEALRAEALSGYGSEDVEAIWPFAEAFFKEKGSASFLGAIYSYLLGRPLDSEGQSFFESSMERGMPPHNVWKTIAGSEEFRNRTSRVLSGPFDPGFPFSLSPLGSRPSQAAMHSGAGPQSR